MWLLIELGQEEQQLEQQWEEVRHADAPVLGMSNEGIVELGHAVLVSLWTCRFGDFRLRGGSYLLFPAMKLGDLVS